MLEIRFLSWAKFPFSLFRLLWCLCLNDVATDRAVQNWFFDSVFVPVDTVNQARKCVLLLIVPFKALTVSAPVSVLLPLFLPCSGTRVPILILSSPRSQLLAAPHVLSTVSK